MPAIAAHYQFGALVLSQLSAPLKSLISAHNTLFTLGLQGPDLLFYHKPLTKSPIATLGHTLHTRSPNALLTPPNSDAQHAYLLGLCAHYGLDRGCHPFINAFSSGGAKQHCILESAFDLLVLETYCLPYQRTKLLPTDVDCSAIALTYGVDKMDIGHCVRSFSRYNRLLDHPKLVTMGEHLIGKQALFSTLCLPSSHHLPLETAHLHTLFLDAVPRTVALLDSFYHNTLPLDRVENFEGVIPPSVL